MLLAAYCAGLTGTVGREVRLRAPVTAEEAVSIAISVEQAELFERRSSSFLSDTKAANSRSVSAPKKAFWRGQWEKGNSKPNPSPPASSVSADHKRPSRKAQPDAPVKCYECAGYGHYARDCANRRQRAGQAKADRKGQRQGSDRGKKQPAEN